MLDSDPRAGISALPPRNDRREICGQTMLSLIALFIVGMIVLLLTDADRAVREAVTPA